MRTHSHLAPPLTGPVRKAVATLVVALCAVFLPVSTASAQDQAALQVVVSLNPYQDLAARVAGDRAQVSTLLPPGASPHAFDPSPMQAARLANADLVIMNGGVDLWLNRLVEATAPATPVLVIMDVLDFAPLAGHEHDHDDHEDHEDHAETDHDQADHDHDDHHDQPRGHAQENGSDSLLVNSHIWLDPVLMGQAVGAIEAALAALDPAGASYYAANAARLTTELAQLDEELELLLAPVAGKPFVPFHDAWEYFARRYQLRIVVTLEPYPGREPSPRYVAQAVQDVIASGATTIFSERQLGSRSAEVVAESAGVNVAELDPLGGPPGPTTYENLLLENARVIVAAMLD